MDNQPPIQAPPQGPGEAEEGASNGDGDSPAVASAERVWELLTMSSAPPALITNTRMAYTRGVPGKIEPLRNPQWKLAAFRVHGALMRMDGAKWLVTLLRRETCPKQPPKNTKRTFGTSYYGANARNAHSRLEARRKTWPQWQTTWRTEPRAWRGQALPSRPSTAPPMAWQLHSTSNRRWGTLPSRNCAAQLWNAELQDL